MKPLIPPDLKQCQAEKTTGDSFMTIGGRPGKMERCKAVPTVVVRERKPGEDGRRGSMSLCDSCLTAFRERFKQGSFSTKKIKQQ